MSVRLANRAQRSEILCIRTCLEQIDKPQLDRGMPPAKLYQFVPGNSGQLGLTDGFREGMREFGFIERIDMAEKIVFRQING